MTYRIRTDRELIRAAGGSDRYVLCELTAPRARGNKARPPVNVSFVLDRSGSMAGQKLDLAKAAVLRAIRLLREGDRFSVVFYDSSVDLVVPSASATTEHKREAARLVRDVQARANTDLFGGWLCGAEQVARFQDEAGVSRVILLTDGLANAGLVDPGEIARHVGELRSRGVSTTTIGVGADYDEERLSHMSQVGGGNFYHVVALPQIDDYLTSELKETLEIVARDAYLAAELPPSVSAEPLTLLQGERRGDEWRIALGDLVSEQDVAFVVRLHFSGGELGSAITLRGRFGDADRVLDDSPIELTWRYADHPSNDAQPRDREVDRAVARAYADRARLEASGLNARGELTAARDALDRVARRVSEYAGDDEVLRSMVVDTAALAEEFAHALDPMTRKVHHFEAMSSSRMRDVTGKARKRQ